MKKNQLALAMLFSAGILSACSNGTNQGTSSTTDSSSTTSTTDHTANRTGTDSSGSAMGRNSGTGAAAGTNNMNTSATAMSSTPLAGADKQFVLKAADGGLMEVALGKMAQQNGNSQRVKDFGAMMERDHTKANDELKSMASAKGLTINEDSLMKKHQDHMAMMQKMTGKAFDDHYMGMMTGDHKKDVAEFKTEASGGKDADVKAFASKTLPVLQMHLDSAQAISKMHK